MHNPTHLFRWAGSKGRIVPEMERRFPSSFTGYIEPFVGSASVYLSVRPHQAILADANERLIKTLTAVRDEVDKVILHLGEFDNTQTCFDYARAQSLAPDFDTKFTNAEIASWLIYLNATCFNGLYRVNGQGYFNVPFGFRRNPTICDAENLRACSAALQNTTIKCADFEETMLLAKPGSLTYCDPPYIGGFTGYTRSGFGACVTKKGYVTSRCTWQSKARMYSFRILPNPKRTSSTDSGFAFMQRDVGRECPAFVRARWVSAST